jgi:hypothetical protein
VNCAPSAPGAAPSALQQQQRPRIGEWHATAAEVTFHSIPLCTAVLAFVGRGSWLYTAPVSRMLRACYMSSLVASGDAGFLCQTTLFAAAQSLPALEHALAHSMEETTLLESSDEKACDPGLLLGATGSLELVQRAIDAGLDDSDCLRGAAATADVATLHELHRRLRNAAAIPPAETAEQDESYTALLLTIGEDMVPDANSASLLVWLSQQRPRDAWPEWYATALCCRAVTGGHTHTLDFLLGAGAGLFGPLMAELPAEDSLDWDDWECFETRYGHGDCDQLVGLLDTAAGAGDQELVQRLATRHGLPFTDYTAPAAAHGGHLRLLQWLRSQPECPFDAAYVVDATLSSDAAGAEQLAWLKQQGCLDLTPAAATQYLIDAVAFDYTPEMATQLVNMGARWPEDLAPLLVSGEWHVFQLQAALETYGCPWGHWSSQSCAALLAADDDASHEAMGASFVPWTEVDAERFASVEWGTEAVTYVHELPGCPCSCGRGDADSDDDLDVEHYRSSLFA